MSARLLCRLDELSDPGSRGFTLEQAGGRGEEIFVVRRGDVVRAYRNACPHTGGPLDWKPDEFLDEEREHIMCATHAAIFRIEDGHCLAGPCRRRSLTPVAIECADGEIRLAD